MTGTAGPTRRTWPTRPSAPAGRRRAVVTGLLTGCGAVCVVAGVVGIVGAGPALRADPVGAVPAAGAATAPAPAAPPSTEPAPADVAAVPVRVLLPQRDVDVPVVPVGVHADGAMELPDRPTTVGWWRSGARPGAARGTVVLAGHVDSHSAGPGAFAVLPALAVGEAVAVRTDDGRDVGYRVVARRQYRKGDLPSEVFARDGPARLVMVTCGGRFDRRRSSYDDNIVVYAEPDPAPSGSTP